MMNDINVKIKKLHPDAVIPTRATSKDVGYDIIAVDDGTIVKGNCEHTNMWGGILYIQYRTGLAIEPPLGYHTELFPRSSISNYDLILCNSVGLIDNGYRSEILVRFRLVGNKTYNKGDRIAQLVLRPDYYMYFQLVDELSESDRVGGFGSTN